MRPTAALRTSGSKLLLLLASAATALLIAEAAVRLAPDASRIGQEAAMVRPVPRNFQHLLVPDADPRILFRLRESVDDALFGARVRTNDLGFRGRPLRQGARRIVGIGDSVMFGWGVEDHETYLARLEDDLRGVDPSIEVVNMAVPAYNTVQEVALLERHLAALRPEWVLLGFIANDFEIERPAFPEASFVARHSSLYRLLRSRAMALEPYLPSRTDRTLRALDGLGRLARARGFCGVCLFYDSLSRGVADGRRLHPRVRERCDLLGFVSITTGEFLREAIAAGAIGQPSDTWLRATEPVDRHPSPLGHAIIAEGLTRFMRGELARDATRRCPGPRGFVLEPLVARPI